MSKELEDQIEKLKEQIKLHKLAIDSLERESKEDSEEVDEIISDLRYQLSSTKSSLKVLIAHIDSQIKHINNVLEIKDE